MNNDFTESIKESMQQEGITPPERIIVDRAIHRFSTNGKRDNKAGYYSFRAYTNDKRRMIEVSFSPIFKRAFKKKIKKNRLLEERFWTKLDLFIKNPFDKELRTHKLSGKLKDLWSFSIEINVRVIFFFADTKKAVLIDTGTHDEVY